ncbi:hypothetical protein GCM10014719_68270 [Planomonospora parontospora subsp. antibiotica]|nr:hypothetical protein GCM10014719_68270 [Planomonospora parontospora subsp. antibiotica]GII20027.1 hypothetical protein Ppa05_67530 [Planomonospora parontospora subsp. antibiotica]
MHRIGGRTPIMLRTGTAAQAQRYEAMRDGAVEPFSARRALRPASIEAPVQAEHPADLL